MTDFTPAQLDMLKGKARPSGKLPYLPDDPSMEQLRAWLTRAFRPPGGWEVQGFERAGRDPKDACWLVVANGRESRTFRFNQQSDLYRNLRTTAVSASDSWLQVPHLTGSEVEDAWAALCRLGQVLTEYDEADEARKWVEQMLVATMPLVGHSLVPDHRHAALMAIKRAGEFTKADALVLLRPGEDQRYTQHPLRFVDTHTGEVWLRAGETACFVRWVLGVEPLSGKTLKARLHEVGVVGRLFEDYRPPHPKLNLYAVPEPLLADLQEPA